jgi:DMSO/TMAO reductase YedYZ molybdopterin-dependent catalytic subunit
VTRRGISRRGFLSATAVTGTVAAGGWLAARRYLDQSPSHPDLLPGKPLALTADGKLLDTDFPDPFAGGEYLGYLPFVREGDNGKLQPGQTVGKGHNARRLIDLASLLTPEGRITPRDEFFIRTEYPDELEAPPEWTVKIHGEVNRPKDVPLPKLLPAIESKGPVLIECSGNSRELRFGQLSVADWAGVPFKEILKVAEPSSKAKAVLFNGFDGDSNLPDRSPPFKTNSWPTCSWIFTLDQLLDAGAFLATELNGQPLPRDQGAPLRLIVPGWYSCAGAKWVNEIKFVDNEQPATLQMREYAGRTFQRMHMDEVNPQPPGMGPDRAAEYRPATIDQVALPVRVEAWRLNGKLNYRVVGITWGGPKRTDKVLIRFTHGNAPTYEPVRFCQTKTSCPDYGIWFHQWQPKSRGPYWIELRFADRTVRARKMSQSTEIGPERRVAYYARLVQVPTL